MSKVWKHGNITLVNAECLGVLRQAPENSVDSIVTDPPYGLSKQPDMYEVLGHWLEGDEYVHNGSGFMGKSWDSFVPGPEIWKECFRILRPGGHIVAFASTRTYDLMAMSIRLGGFELRDTLCWHYGSGMPKSHNISKAIDKMSGKKRVKIPVGNPVKRMIPGADQDRTGSWIKDNGRQYQPGVEIPATEEAKYWDGWGTGLKPATELIVLARKPVSEGTIASNVLRWGTGGLNIDKCRVGTSKSVPASVSRGIEGNSLSGSVDGSLRHETGNESGHNPNVGRFPANLVHDGSPEVLEYFPDSKGQQGEVKNQKRLRRSPNSIYGSTGSASDYVPREGSGSAARFFYCAKTSRKERQAGCDSLYWLTTRKKTEQITEDQYQQFEVENEAGEKHKISKGNNHPTVKPVSLMTWLVSLVTPPEGRVLDPFNGSGSTGVACAKVGFPYIGIEKEENSCTISKARILYWLGKK